MLAIYEAQKGLKLYGDEVFCISSVPVPNSLNRLRNGDLRYKLEFWTPGANTTLTLVKGKLRVENTSSSTAANASQVVNLVSGADYVLRVNSRVSEYNHHIRVWEDGTLTTQVASVTDIDLTGSYWLKFTAPGDSVYLELVLAVGTAGAYADFYDMLISEYVSSGVPWSNLISNSFFSSDVTGWSVDSGGVVTQTRGRMVLESTTGFGLTYVTFTPVANAFYRFTFKFFIQAAVKGRVYVGTTALNPVWGDYGEMSADEDGYIVFRPTTAATVFLVLNVNLSGSGNFTEWDDAVAYRSNDVLIDGRFAKVSAFWSLGSWAASTSGGKATISGGRGSRLTQAQTGALVVGSGYMFSFRLTIPSESLTVTVMNTELDTTLVSATYTASGVYSLFFLAESTDYALVFESAADSAALEVTNVRGGLAVAGADGNGAFIEGEVSVVSSSDNTDTPVLATLGQADWGRGVPIKDALSVPVTSAQNVGTGDWSYTGWSVFKGVTSGGDFVFIKRNDASRGYKGEPAIEGRLSDTGVLQFRISDDGMVTSDIVQTHASVPPGPFMWELIRSGTQVSIRINSVNSSRRVELLLAAGSLDNTQGVNYLGDYNVPAWDSQSGALDNTWIDITHGNGTFVAVATSGAGGLIMTSPDGVEWEPQTAPVANVWRAVTHGNGVFVAVASSGTGNRVMTSTDGKTWTSQLSAADNDWRSVTYAITSGGNGLFVAVASTGVGNRVMTSPDGETWTSQLSAADNNWLDVTYGASVFVAVASSGVGNRVMTSPDGANWTIRTSAADNVWADVVFAEGIFVAVATSGVGNRVMTSFNGANWTIRTSAADNEWRGVTHGNGVFVAVASTGTGNRVMTSEDGLTWIDQVNLGGNEWKSIAYGGGLFVAVSGTGTGNRVMTSPYYLVSGRPTGAYGASSLVRFNPSANQISRSRDIYQAEKHLFNVDQKYTIEGESVVINVDSPERLDTSTNLIGNVFVPDSGEGQETVVRRLELALSATSRELTYYEAIEYRAFMEAVVRGIEFTYDPYALDSGNLINPMQVYLTQQSFTPTRIGSLEYFRFSWAMRMKGSL